eukprot:scaffold151938_cov45-Prasinocladus_malaysianus.AAC.1
MKCARRVMQKSARLRLPAAAPISFLRTLRRLSSLISYSAYLKTYQNVSKLGSAALHHVFEIGAFLYDGSELRFGE